MIYGEIICKWNDIEGPVIICIVPAAVADRAGQRTGQNRVKSGKDKGTRRLEDLGGGET